MELTVVTSSYNYGQYLREWAQSIINSRIKPTKVIIVDNASDDGHSEQDTEAAFGMLVGAGIPAAYYLIGQQQDGKRVDLGTARNLAVSKAETEWVMHLDADDMLMPHCIDECVALEREADVIALGYERCGDLASGPRNKTRIYSNTTGQQTLDAVAPASGVSPFRKSFWERSPYRTDMRGGWDTALWIGFAKLNARFRAPKRPCFWYRQHGDSIFNTRRNNARRSALVGSKLQSLRRGDTGVTVIVPWRSDDTDRAKAWALVQKFYAENFPDWQLVVAGMAETDWRKGVAVMRAIEAAATGATLIIADADCLIEPDALREAVRLVESGEAPWVVPHRLVKRLTEKTTAELYAAHSADWGFPLVDLAEFARHPYEGFAGGGMVVVGRAEYQATGGIPAGFKGWGAEDEALALILDTLLGPHVRLEHDLWHLWHAPGARARSDGYVANRRLYAQLDALKADPDALWEFVRSSGGTTNGVKPVEAGSRSRDPARVAQEAALDVQFNRLKTLEIREQQRLRNIEATEERARQSFEDQRLAQAGRVGRSKGRIP